MNLNSSIRMTTVPVPRERMTLMRLSRYLSGSKRVLQSASLQLSWCEVVAGGAGPAPRLDAGVAFDKQAQLLLVCAGQGGEWLCPRGHVVVQRDSRGIEGPCARLHAPAR